MADDVQDPVGTAPAEPSASGASAVSDPRDTRLAELEQYYRESQATFERLKPVEEDVLELLNDEGFREFSRSARKTYKQTVEEQKKAEADALSPDGRRLLAEIENRLKPALEEVDVLRKDRESRTAREAAETKKAAEEFARREVEFANRLVAEGKLTSEEAWELGELANAAHAASVKKGEPRFVGIEEVYKRVYGRAEAKAAPAVPKSLRAKSAAPGVPGASKPDPADRGDLSRQGGVTRHMLGVLNSNRKTG